MPLLSRKSDPEVEARREAQRQLDISAAIEAQRAERRRSDRAATQHAQWLRRAAYEDAEAAREDLRMQEFARAGKEKEARAERQREQAAALDRQRVSELKQAQGDVAALESAVRELRIQPVDLSTPAGVMAAGETESRIEGLKQALQRAQSRLVQAERACGIHRSGGF